MEESYIREAEVDEQDLYRAINQIWEEQELIAKQTQEIKADMELFDDVQREVREIFKEIWKHCEEDMFIMQMEECADDLWESGRRNENKLEERKEILEEKKRKAFDREDEIKEQLRRKKNGR